jgi:hypothetical protein
MNECGDEGGMRLGVLRGGEVASRKFARGMADRLSLAPGHSGVNELTRASLNSASPSPSPLPYLNLDPTNRRCDANRNPHLHSTSRDSSEFEQREESQTGHGATGCSAPGSGHILAVFIVLRVRVRRPSAPSSSRPRGPSASFILGLPDRSGVGAIETLLSGGGSTTCGLQHG